MEVNVITPEEWARLLQRQEQLEDNSMARGAKRFRRRLEKAAQKEQLSTFGAAKRLLTGGLDKLEAAITDFSENQKGSGSGRHCALKWIRKLGEDAARVEITQRNEKRKLKDQEALTDEACGLILAKHMKRGYEAVAYMTLKVILDGIEQKRSLYLVATTIADLIRDELRYRRFRELAPRLYEYKINSFNTSSYAHMARSLDGSIKGLRCPACLAASRDMTLSEKRAAACPHMAEAFTDLTISPNHRYLLGAKLVDLLITSTGLVTVFTETVTRSRVGKKSSAKKLLCVEAEPETLEWLSKRNRLLEALTPVNLPMVVPPLQWAPGEHGGYRFALRAQHPLVRGVSREHMETINTTSMPLVYQAVNAIQNTAWKVNTDVLKVLEDIKEQGGGLAGVPLQDLIELPPKPHNIGGEDREAEIARTDWKRKAHKVREQNKLRARDVLEYERKLDIVKQVKDERAIFFPHSLDFRGRIYPVALAFSPQGEDVSRGLLQFATGRPIGEQGVQWLAIHGANCLGEWNGQKVSKMALGERIQLIQYLSDDICAAGRDPLGGLARWWATAEEPVQFLAFCLEWRRFWDSGCSLDFISTLPVSIDGTCNGLQHFGALLRDEIGGAAVNLVPSDRPSDIYEHIAEHVKDQLQAEPDNPVAMKWLQSQLVKRKLTKRPTMTFGYGSKPYGFQQQLCEYVQGLGSSSEESKAMYEEVKKLFEVKAGESGIVQACGDMSQRIWKALQETVVAASKGMAWMQACARVIVKSGKGVTWSVPATGFPVKQEYFVQNVQQIETMIAGKVVRPAVYTPTAEIELHKQANAIAPNVVHSLDAAALMLTIAQAMNEGIESFAAIHDSYGCLAGDMPILAQTTRSAFVALYTQHDVVHELRVDFMQQADNPEDIPEAPPKGNLDISGVLASDYFFS